MVARPTRRDVVRGLFGTGATALAGCSDRDAVGSDPGTAPPTPTAAPGGPAGGAGLPTFEHFVERSGTEFVVDGAPYYFSGANNYFIQERYPAAEGTIDEIVPEAAELGLGVLRTWAFGSGEPDRYQPEPGEYNEAEFRRLDEVIAAAGRHGVRLILPLVNGYDNLGGMSQYVEWSPTAETHDDFYTDERCRSLYRDYVEYVLTRENTYTGVEYREDPTIAIWELANEPRLADHPERRWDESDYEPMQSWFDEMARFVGDVDGNHLVSTGSEGNYGDGTFGHEGGPGEYVGDHESEAIDAASFHLYHRYDADPERWVETHVTDAHETLGKPAYLGEFGTIHVDRRAEFFRTVYEALDASGGNGAAFWQLVGRDGETGALRTPEPDRPVDASGYFVHYPESEDVIPEIREFAETQRAKAGSTNRD